MDPRMTAREWFLDKPGNNKYDIEVHVQRSFWYNGFGQAFFRCTRAEPPYKCIGYWRGQEIELEWIPRQWVILSMQRYDDSMVESVNWVIRLKPSLRYSLAASDSGHSAGAGSQAEGETTAHERFVVEWHVRNVEERMRDLAEQAGVRDVRRM